MSTVSEARALPRFTLPGKTLSVGLETNGLGFIGFIIELPGAFVRGETETRALSKVIDEAVAYHRWTRISYDPPTEILVAQRHNCKLQVQDADCEILLDSDRGIISKPEFSNLMDLAIYSGETFERLYEATRQKDWVDPARVRATFNGPAPKTIREIFQHVDKTQRYYLSRAGLETPRISDDFLAMRIRCMKQLWEQFNQTGNSKVFSVAGEQWTLKKILRRFIWHDRIHGKSIHRMLTKQRNMGLIDGVEDPFRFDA